MAPWTSNAQYQPIQLSFDILDYIFSFLRYDPRSLLACSEANPAFSPIVERHLYYCIIITQTASPSFDHGYTFKSPQLIKLISVTPQVIKYVRVLQIVFCGHLQQDSGMYEDITLILPTFCMLETIIFTTKYHTVWYKLPETLKTAMEACLRLPTLRNVSIGTLRRFPLSILNNSPNIDCLTFFERPKTPDCSDDADDANTFLQIKSLILDGISGHRPSFWNWAKRHITKLQSLECAYVHSSEKEILDALEICSGTLNNLDLEIKPPYKTIYYLDTRKPVSYSATPPMPLINISSLPLLQHITLRVAVYYDNALASDSDSEYSDYDSEYSDYDNHEFCVSCLPSAVEILKTASSLQRVTIEFNIDNIRVWHSIDFSSLAALAESASFQHVDFYCLGVTHSRILTELAGYENLKKWIENGVLVIHADEAAPGISQLIY